MILMFTDVHLTDNPRHEYRWEFFNHIYSILESDVSIEAVFILGDLCDRKDKHSSILVNRVVSTLTRLSKKAPLYILKGNHDEPDGGVPFWGFLGEIHNIVYITKPLKYRIMEKDFLFLPHTRDEKKDWSSVPNMLPVDYVIMHQTITGAKLSSGFSLDGIDVDLFRGTPIISGDVHTPQVTGGVNYIGSPYNIHYGDDYKGRYCYLKKSGLQFVEYDAPLLSVLNLTKHDDFSIVFEENKGNFVRIKFHTPMKELDTWQIYKEKIMEECTKHNITVDSIEVTLNQITDIDEIHNEVMEDVMDTISMNPDKVFNDYVKSENIDNEKLIYIGRDLLKG